jgi:hypothetical protein
MKKMFALLLLTIGVNAQFNSTRSWMERVNTILGVGTAIPSRAYGVSFVVDNQGYIATGESGSSTLSDCWRFTTDETFGIWSQCSNIPGGGRSFAFAFSIANIGYVGGGNGTAGGYNTPRQDFYKYIVGTNSWTGVANLPVANRGASATFTTANGGYVIGGSPTPGINNTSNNTCMRYEPGTNTWNTSIANIPTTSNRLMFAFGYTVSVNGFVTCGFEHGIAWNPLWRYDEAPINSWTEISFATPTARFPGTLRRAPSGFVLGNTPYIGLGFASGTAQTSFFFYNSTTSSWIQTPNYPFNNGIGAVGFTINPGNRRERGFIASGAIANPPNLVATNTNTEYQPFYITSDLSNLVLCANTVLGIPIYADRAFNHSTTVFTAQLVTYDGTNFTVINNNIGNVTGVHITNRTNTVQVAFPNVAASFNGYYIRLTSSEGPVTLTGGYGPITINPAPNPPSTIVGPPTICQNSTRLYTVRNDFLTTTPGGQWARRLVWTTNNTNASFLGQNFSNTGFNAPNTVLGLRVASVLGLTPGTTNLSVYELNTATGCMSTTVTSPITVVSVPNIPTITGTKNLCNLTPTVYSVASQAGATYTWSFAGTGATLLSSGNNATITGTISNNTNSVITVTSIVARSTCSERTNYVITINGCCRPYYSNTVGVNSILGAGSSQPVLDAGGGVVTLSGSFNVIGTLTLINGSFVLPYGSTFWVEENVRINIAGNAALSITGATVIKSCFNAFYGISVAGSLFTTSAPGIGKRTTIMGAYTAIHPDSIAGIYIKNTYFDENYVTINIKNNIAPNSYINNNYFGCDGITSTCTGYGNPNSNYNKKWIHIVVHNSSIPVSISGNTIKNSEYGIDVSASPVNVKKNYFESQRHAIGFNAGSSSPSYFIGNEVYMNTEIIGFSMRGISCFSNIEIAQNYIHDSDANPSTGITSSAIELSCDTSISHVVSAHHNTISGLSTAFEATDCNAIIDVYQNYLTNNTYCFRGANSFQLRIDAHCNTIRNTTYGYFSQYSKGTVPGIITQGTTTGPAANKFINVTNPLYYSGTGLFLYFDASDGNAGNFVSGGGNATVNTTGISVSSECGTPTPGLRKSADEKQNSLTIPKVFPNPFSEQLTIEFESETETKHEIYIYNSLGYKVHESQKVSAIGTNTWSIPNGFHTGLYLMILKTDSNQFSYKLIKN